MRKREISSSSFDLFLDTICNTFGGIVFLAILLAVLIQTRSVVKTTEHSDESPPSPSQVRELIARLDESVAEHASISATLAALPERKALPEDVAIRSFDSQRQTLEANVGTALTELAERSRELAAQLDRNAILTEQNAAVPRELQEVKSAAAEKSAAFSKIVTGRQTTLRLPRDRETKAATVLALLYGSRFYLATLPEGDLRTFNNDQVTTESTIGAGIRVRPRLGLGWKLGDQRIQSAIEASGRRGKILTIAVSPDSFDDFESLKKLLVKEAVLYQLLPQVDSEELTVFIGSGQNRAQ